MKKILLLVLACSPMFASSPENKEIIRPSPKRFYINNLDVIEFYKGSFRVFFYMSENFDVFDAVCLKRIRANKKGIYFLEGDIREVFHEPWDVLQPPTPSGCQDEFPPDVIAPLPIDRYIDCNPESTTKKDEELA